MPLSKARNRDRMRRSRLHAKIVRPVVQPKPMYMAGVLINMPDADVLTIDKLDSMIETIKRAGRDPSFCDIDADGNPIYEEK